MNCLRKRAERIPFGDCSFPFSCYDLQRSVNIRKLIRLLY